MPHSPTMNRSASSSFTRSMRAMMVVVASTPVLLIGTAGAASAGEAADGVVQRSVSFTVVNKNDTSIPCTADGATYTVRGHITGPQSALNSPTSVTVVEHGLSYGEFFADYNDQAGYNFAEKQAADGNVTVTVDRLGYGASDKPIGQNICFGSRADISHQIVQQLRSGDYTTDGEPSAAFHQVVLAGHSVGGIIAQAEAYTFGDVDGLIVLSYSDTDVSADATAALSTAITECTAGGGPHDGASGPGGYVYFGAATTEMFVKAHFYTPNADPDVVSTTAGMRSHDPCGDITSYKAAVATNLANIGSITVPALVLTGGNDAIYPVPADKQAALFTGSGDVTAVTIADTGHALTLHRSGDEFSADITAWLHRHDFGSNMPTGGVQTGAGGTSSVSVFPLTAGGLLLLLGAALFARTVRQNRRFEN